MPQVYYVRVKDESLGKWATMRRFMGPRSLAKARIFRQAAEGMTGQEVEVISKTRLLRIEGAGGLRSAELESEVLWAPEEIRAIDEGIKLQARADNATLYLQELKLQLDETVAEMSHAIAGSKEKPEKLARIVGITDRRAVEVRKSGASIKAALW